MSNRLVRIFRKQEREKEQEKKIASPPCEEKEREEYFHDSVFQALAFLRSKLRSEDSAEGMEAATAILSLEATRMRHGQRVAGTGNGVMSKEEYEAEMDRTVHGTPAAKPAPVETVVPPTDEEAECKAFEKHVDNVLTFGESLAKDMGLDGWRMNLASAHEFIETVLNKRKRRPTGLDPEVVMTELIHMITFVKAERSKRAMASAVPA